MNKIKSQRRLSLGKMVLGGVCAPCNNGWMSGVESRAKPLLERNLKGEALNSHTVEVVAFDRLGREVDRDSLVVNPTIESFRVSIDPVTALASSGQVDVAASVSLPPEGTLDRVEFYWNDALVRSFSKAPFEARVSAEASNVGVDFLRVAAFLNDGRMAEDVKIFSAGAAVEEIEVNLVEIFVVVTDRQGDPVRDLERGEIEVQLRGRPVTI